MAMAMARWRDGAAADEYRFPSLCFSSAGAAAADDRHSLPPPPPPPPPPPSRSLKIPPVEPLAEPSAADDLIPGRADASGTLKYA